MAEQVTSITDLPLDILVLIFPYLDAKSFLALCSTCKSFQQPSIRLDPAYWSYLTRATFRVPNQPVVQNDGLRWQKMFRRLLTQSRVFTWGQNGHNRLGHAAHAEDATLPRRPHMRTGLMRPGRLSRYNANEPHPTEMDNTRNLGVIADMQCGGWSTTLLTSKGSLHTAGVLDGQRITYGTEPLQALRFPAGYPPNAAESQYEEPTIAIRQFSSGRAHILALSDSGRLWSWSHVKQPALQVKFATLQIKELALRETSSTESTFGQIKQVVAGWSRSSALVTGVGIVVWDPVERDHGEESIDTMLVLEHAEVPQTGYQRLRGMRETDQQKEIGDDVGVVTNYIMLEHFVVFTTDLGKTFCGRFSEKNKVDEIIELRQLRHERGAPLDVQGSFRSFAIFRNGEVITSDQNYLESCVQHRHDNPEQTGLPGLKKIPALQNSDVISVAFGDYHYLALHANGKITSYGMENNACGALGLGSDDRIVGKARGIVYDRFNANGHLLPHAYTSGRQVWFDSRKNEWLAQIAYDDAHAQESEGRRQMWDSDPSVQGEVSEWFEQEARAWDEDGEDGLGAHFVLRVSAAGWHSGALVLVNEELAQKEPTYNRDARPFPRLRLSDGREMPGEKDFDGWRNGRPVFQLDVQI